MPCGTTLPSSSILKSCTFTPNGSPLGRQSEPPFLKLPISPFFFVSTEMTGWPAAWAAITCALMCSNCALRSGWLVPSCVLRLTCREYLSSSTSSRPTVFGLTSWPRALSSAASFSRLLETHIRGRIGSPIVAGSTSRLKSATNVSSVAVIAWRPPPLAAHTTGLQCRRVEVLQPANDPRPREPGNLGQGGDAAPSCGPRFARSEQTFAALIPLRAVRQPPQPNPARIDHPTRLARRTRPVNPPESIGRMLFHTQDDSFIFAGLLSYGHATERYRPQVPSLV